MNQEIQWITLGWMLFSGAALGMVYDSYRVLSLSFRFPRWSIHTIDLVYWIAAAVFVFNMLYASNHGELRFYVFLGLFLGVWVYFLVLSVLTQKFVVMLIGIIKKFCYLLYRALYVILVIPIKGILRLLRILFGFVMALLLFLIRMVYYIIRPFLKLLYLPIRPLISKWQTPSWMVRMFNRVKEWWNYWF